MDKPASQVLEEAVELIETGWHQGWMQNEDGTAYCAIGAMWKVTAASDGLSYNLAHNALFDHIGSSITNWNDVIGRTKEEVIDAMMQTAKQLRNRGE